MTVLVVEDDDAVARALGRILKSHVELAFVTTTRAAIEWLDANEPTALLVDVMANGAGFTVVEHEHRLRASTQAVMISGRTERSFVNRAAALGAVYLVKPVDPAQLVRIVARSRLRRSSGVRRIAAAVELTQSEHGLTSRETQILHLVAVGTDRARLAAMLGCEESTVKTHVNNLLRKLADGKTLSDAVADLLRRIVTEEAV